MCDDSGYVQDERATACFATGNSSDPSALLPGQKQVWSHAWCRSCSTANFDDRTQEEHSSLPSLQFALHARQPSPDGFQFAEKPPPIGVAPRHNVQVTSLQFFLQVSYLDL